MSEVKEQDKVTVKELNKTEISYMPDNLQSSGDKRHSVYLRKEWMNSVRTSEKRGKTSRKNQSELKNLTTEMKNTLGEINS